MKTRITTYHVALWGVRVLLLLFLLAGRFVLVIRGRDVMLHLLLVTELVLLGFLDPLLVLLLRKSLELGRKKTGLI